MSKNNNIIEINGKRYDARTGQALDQPTRAAHSMPSTPPKPAAHHAVTRKAAKHAASHAPQPTQTLMRHTVKQPAPGSKRHLKAHGHTDALVKQPAIAVATKPSLHSLDEQRLKHAKRVPKSRLVSHFNPVEPVVFPTTTPAQRVHHAVRPAAVKQRSHTPDPFQHALERATSHKQPAPKRRRKVSLRITGISAAALSVAVMAYVTAQNLPSVRLDVASAKAGFSASLPRYKPAGYHLAGVQHSPGVIALNYQSNSDDRTFTVTEKTSAWDSATLRDDFVATTGQAYDTAEADGRTVYLYGQHDATWVSGGVWYQVHSAGALSDHQLLQLAGSL